MANLKETEDTKEFSAGGGEKKLALFAEEL